MRLFSLLAILAFLISTSPAIAQTPALGPQFHLAQCNGVNNTQICRVPVFVQNSTGGTTIYWWNVTNTFVSNSIGDLFTASTTLAKAPDVPGTGSGGSTGGGTGSGGGTFVAGQYRQIPSPSSARENLAIIEVKGPGPGGLWTATATADSKCGFPQSITWYAGVPVGSTHPLGPRLVAAGITTNNYSYGSGGGFDQGVCIGAPTGFRSWWGDDSLAGAVQLNPNTLVFVSFTDRNNRNKPNVPDQWEKDGNSPGGTVTYERILTTTTP